MYGRYRMMFYTPIHIDLEMVTIMDSLVHIADQEEAFLDLQVPTSNY